MFSEEDFSPTLREVSDEWKELTSSPDPPRSMMNVIEYGLGEMRRGEVYMTRFLRYLMDPSEPHGLETEFLKVFLDGFASRFEFEEPTYDLSNVRVRNEVWTRHRGETESDLVDTTHHSEESEATDTSGRIDLVVDEPGDWFFLIELKFSAEENNLAGSGLSQTEFYRAATHIGETPKTDYEGNGYYAFLHMEGTNPARSSEFANWTWEDMTRDVLEPFITKIGPTIPHRTLVHLTDLRDDIKNFTGMTPDESQTYEKAELYLEHYPILNDLHKSFEAQWQAFTDQWNADLAQMLEDVIDRSYEVEEGIIAVSLDDSPIDSTWYLRAKHKDWQQIYKNGWYKPEHQEQWVAGELEHLHDKAPDHNTFRIFFHHRMDTHRDTAIEDNTLIFTFRKAGANPTPFHGTFAEAFDDRQQELLDHLPDSVEWLGQKSDQFEVQYDIPDPDPETESAPDDFFEAYTAALRTAFIDLIVERPELISTITEIYTDAIEEHMESIQD